MLSKRNARSYGKAIHAISQHRHSSLSRGLWLYWPVIVFILLSAFAQTGLLFAG